MTRTRDLMCGNLVCGAPPTIGPFATIVVSQDTCTVSVRTDTWASLAFGQMLVDPVMVNGPELLPSTWQAFSRQVFSDANPALRLLDVLHPRVNTPPSPTLLRDDRLGPLAHAGETRSSGLRGWDRCCTIVKTSSSDSSADIRRYLLADTPHRRQTRFC